MNADVEIETQLETLEDIKAQFESYLIDIENAEVSLKRLIDIGLDEYEASIYTYTKYIENRLLKIKSEKILEECHLAVSSYERLLGRDLSNQDPDIDLAMTHDRALSQLIKDYLSIMDNPLDYSYEHDTGVPVDLVLDRIIHNPN